MTADSSEQLITLRLLLDEHYPGWLADELTAEGVDTVALTQHRPHLRGVSDQQVLESAVAEGRAVVTEDVSTFAVAIANVPTHLGVVFCHHRRFPRTRPGLVLLRRALVTLARHPPAGWGEQPLVWWLEVPEGNPKR